MNIENLKNILSVPDRPSEVPSPGDWSQFESTFGLLPEDYKSYIEIYGTGQIDWFLSIFNPFSKSEFNNLRRQANEFSRMLAAASKEFYSYRDLVGFPPCGGLLPFGQTDGGCYLTWVTRGSLDAWTVAIMGSRSPDLEHFSMGFMPFLITYLSGHITPSFLPEPSIGTIEFVNRIIE